VVRAFRVGEGGDEVVGVGLGVEFIVEEPDELVGVGGCGPDGSNRSRILLLINIHLLERNAFDGTCEKIDKLTHQSHG
jgi:hypothetical protein